MVQGKYTQREKQRLPFRRWCRGPLFFLHWFLHFTLLLLLHHNGKLAIPHNHLFLILHIFHLVLFKLLQIQGELSISGDSRVVFWWARDGNHRLSLLGRAGLPFVRNGFVAIYFQPIFDCQFRKVVLLVLQQYGKNCVVFSGRSTPFEISGCAIDLLDGAQSKCKHKPWFAFYTFLWTFRRLTILGFPVNLSATIAKYQSLEIVYRAHAGAVEGSVGEGAVGEGKSFSWGGAKNKGEVHKRELTNNMFLHSDLLTSLSSSLTPLFFTIKKLALRTCWRDSSQINPDSNICPSSAYTQVFCFLKF